MENFENNNVSGGFEIEENLPEEFSEDETAEKKNTPGRELLEWLEILSVSVIIVVVLFTFVFRVATIDGDSMQDTLYDSEKVIITKLGYKPSYKDIVVISRNTANVSNDKTVKEPIIKRVIATGGQTVDIDFENAVVYVDGVALDEPYISNPTDDRSDVEFPVYVPEGYVFVLGDNRGNSMDSRFKSIGENGLIKEDYILGHAVFRVLPFSRFGSLTNE